VSKPQDNGRESREERCAWLGTAQEFVTGRLDAERDAAFRAHLAAGCAVCAADLELTRALQADFDAARFASDASLPDAPASLKQRVLESVHGLKQESTKHDDRLQTWRRWREPDAATPGGLRTQRAGEGAWETTSCPGVSVRQLSLDAAARQCTMMVRMEPGSSYPPHRHGGAEECFVVAGDLHVGEEVLTTGDFQRAEEGSIHGVQSTEGGCTLLIVSSLDDELLPADA